MNTIKMHQENLEKIIEQLAVGKHSPMEIVSAACSKAIRITKANQKKSGDKIACMVGLALFRKFLEGCINMIENEIDLDEEQIDYMKKILLITNNLPKN